jgi:hypothetical protein
MGSCTPPPTSTIPTWPCYTGSDPNGHPSSDLSYSGSVNTVHNTIVFSSHDGSCTGPLGYITMVIAEDQVTAQGICSSLGQGYAPGGVPPLGMGISYPAFVHYWGCQFTQLIDPSIPTTTTTTTPTSPLPAWACHTGLFNGNPQPDISFSGSYDVVHNAIQFSSTNGSCTGPAAYFTLVAADSLIMAQGFCSNLGQGEVLFGVLGLDLGTEGYAAMGNDWACQFNQPF